MLGVLAPVTASTAAWADGPQHVTSTFAGEGAIPAGDLGDFAYHIAFTGSENSVIFTDRTIDHFTLHFTHTNLATGFTLTETYHRSVFTPAVGQIKKVGIFWHPRNADEKLLWSRPDRWCSHPPAKF